MSIKIGINPISWSNDDKQSLGGDTPLETCLSEIKQAGYAGLEMYHKLPREAAALTGVLAPHGLELISGWYSGELLSRTVEEEITAVQPHLRLLKAMDCKVMVWAEVTGCVHGAEETPVTQRPVIAENQWDGFAARMTAMGDYLISQGIQMAYHHHMGTVIETEAEVDRLMEMTGPSVGLLLDTGHLHFAGGDPHAVLDRWMDRICHIHCKDIRQKVLEEFRAGDWSFPQGRYRRCLHRAGGWLHRLYPDHRETSEQRICRLAGGRSRAGSGQGQPAQIRPPGLPASKCPFGG